MKFLNILFLVLYSTLVLGQINDQKPVTNFMDLDASGKISLLVKTFDQNIQCDNLPVFRGDFQLCTKEILPVYHFYVNRDCTAGNWYYDITRLYDYFPTNKITKDNRLLEWIETNLTKSERFSEVFKSERVLGSGVEYKHTESRKHNIKFIVANDSMPVYEDETKFQLNYDWEESIKGKYAAFYTTGKKYQIHSYEIKRFIFRNKKIMDKGEDYLVDILATGKIEQFYINGAKQKTVEYKDVIQVNKKEKWDNYEVKSKRKAKVLECHPNKKIKAKGEYLDGLKNGKWDYYYDTGKIKEKISYHNGTPVGEYKVFSEKGTVIEKGKYEEGVRINK